ncbi:hypothetical protein [Corynebacterium sphenisci]|uniref:hypothetical protein n=1 Tax=Corynebacterium sphenisci TaxID=191493 RepID=UPI0026DFFE3F|nr:hypothetical protein [Corynebacterium sphenisci]MDO5730844.1 hypothetical protein [Corynebacterium sphenisci]
MGRLLIIVLIIAAIVLLWRAFGPGAAGRSGLVRVPAPRPIPGRGPARPPAPKGPDDDEDFLWRLEKEAFERRRRAEREAERRRREDGGAGGGG